MRIMRSFIKKSLSNLTTRFAAWLPNQWHIFSWPQLLLSPLVLLFYLLSSMRRFCYRIGLLRSVQLPVPVIVVGNIAVGGTGKTPLTIALVHALKARGFKPGVISRGYGRESKQTLLVSSTSTPDMVGDEPLLIATKTESPVYVGQDRVAAAQALLSSVPGCDVLVADDGLQHYRLKRQVEIAVVDGQRGFGNQWLLPAGPLREPVHRLKTLDTIVVNGGEFNSDLALRAYAEKVFAMALKPSDFYQLISPENKVQAEYFSGKTIKAVAGIGNPARFFQQLTSLGLQFNSKGFADHHEFVQADFAQMHDDVILLTEKDAVKCHHFADARFWVLPVAAEIDQRMVDRIEQKLNRFKGVCKNGS